MNFLEEGALAQVDSNILILSKEFSAGVTQERNAINPGAFARLGQVWSCSSLSEYLNSGVSTAPKEYEVFFKTLPARNLKVLDIGVASGESSLYLASLGHEVWAVEPSFNMCRLISRMKDNLDLSVHPICSVGEDIDRLTERNFDVVAFNASLHHCDDPLRALKNAYKLLKPSGTIFLSAETQLRFWQSKVKWQRWLEEHPEQSGHYGGNEHAYYSWEYINLLHQAGFSCVSQMASGMFRDKAFRVEFDRIHAVGVHQRAQPLKYQIRVIYYSLMQALSAVTPLFKILARWSVVPSQYQAKTRI